MDNRTVKEGWVVCCFIGGEVLETPDEVEARNLFGEECDRLRPEVVLAAEERWVHLSAALQSEPWMLALTKMTPHGTSAADLLRVDATDAILRHWRFFLEELVGEGPGLGGPGPDPMRGLRRTWQMRIYRLQESDAPLGTFAPKEQEARAITDAIEWWSGWDTMGGFDEFRHGNQTPIC